MLSIYCVDVQIDQAETFASLGGFTTLAARLNDSNVSVRDGASLTVAAACQRYGEILN